jgi:hypothetical protein
MPSRGRAPALSPLRRGRVCVAEDPGAEGFAVLSKRGITVVDSNLFGVPGRKRLASMALPEPVSQSG